MVPIYIIIVLFAARLAWHIVCLVRYYRSAYFKGTHQHYFSVMRDPGKRGECLLYKSLKHFEEDGAHFLFNVYIPQNNERTTEIDAIMIHSSGVYVFENKNYTGQIYGGPNDAMWCQRIRKEDGKGFTKNDFWNPIRQNDLHIRHLKRLFPDAHPIHSVIVFGNRSELQNVSECINGDFSICHTSSAANIVTRLSVICGHAGSIDQERVEQLYAAMYSYSQVSAKVKLKHIVNIQKNHQK